MSLENKSAYGEVKYAFTIRLKKMGILKSETYKGE